uniref:LCCL domain-containing protein n=1 Tax=Electrophorus electricus TaxID=8005 RepID=A0AAY5ERV2_ELEEL
MPLAVSPLTRARMTALALALAIFAQSVLPTAPWPSSDLHTVLEKHMQSDGTRAAHTGRTDITANDRQAILDLHNQLRAQVHPPASNMEYMVWDSELERMAEEWAETCMWEHGPASLLPHIGQNLGVHWGRYRPPTSHVQAWYDEVRDYSFPYPQECRPHCPFKCTGAQVCTHYTQLVWATSSRVGCAIHVCYDMKVGEQIWGKAVYLVCNYSPKGNWWGSAPYKPGASCSACPPSYGGVCKNSLCYRGAVPQPELHVTAFMTPLPACHCIHDITSCLSLRQLSENSLRNCPIITLPWTFTAQLVTCDTKLRDQCKGTPCNRYECPAGCVDSTAKVVGTVHYDMQSSICRVGLHSGVIDNGGGWLDITRQGRKDFFIKSQKHGMTIIKLYIYTLILSLSPPRIYCPPNCLREHSWTSRVIGTRTYLDRSSVCGAAVHAGVIRNELGGYVDVMPTSSRNQYISSYQNGMLSESLQNPPGAMAFRVFAVI